MDLVVIGAGSAGVRAARLAGSLGKKTVLVENSNVVGGTCVHKGCVPKKLYTYASSIHEELRGAPGFGWNVQNATHGWSILQRNVQSELTRLDGIYRQILEKNSVELISGEAAVSGPNQIRVGQQEIRAENIIIATGGFPWKPNIVGVEHASISDDFFMWKQIPKRSVIVGGGYIACELACVLQNLGSQVSVVIRSKRVLRSFDFDLRQAVMNNMKALGVNIITSSNVEQIVKTREQTDSFPSLKCHLDSGAEIDCEAVLFATGRKPNVPKGTAEVGVKINEKTGAIVVDEYSRSSIPSIFALGDVTNRVNLTPVAIAEAKAVIETLYKRNPTAMRYEFIPSAVCFLGRFLLRIYRSSHLQKRLASVLGN